MKFTWNRSTQVDRLMCMVFCQSTTIQNWKSKRILLVFFGPRANFWRSFCGNRCRLQIFLGRWSFFCQKLQPFSVSLSNMSQLLSTWKLDSLSFWMFFLATVGSAGLFSLHPKKKGRQGTLSKRYATFAVELVWRHPSTTWYTSNRLGVACPLAGAKPGKYRLGKSGHGSPTVSPQQNTVVTSYGRILRDYKNPIIPEKKGFVTA